MVDPIVITEADLINPPLGGKTPTLGKSPANILGEIKAGIKQAREIVELAKSMGLNLKLPGGLLTQGDGEPPGEAPGAANPVSQALAFVQMLIMKYGDITVNELVEKLRADMGDKKLSKLFSKEK